MQVLSEDVFSYFGNKARTARFLGYSKASVGEWGEVVPEISALRLELLTDKELVLDPSLYPESPISRLATA